METDRNNISKKFKEIKDQFNELLNNSNKKKIIKKKFSFKLHQ